MRLSRSRCVELLLIIAIALTSVSLFAQNTISGEITGVITDPSSAVVANATVTLTSKEMGNSQTVTTGANGVYRFPLLRPGQYVVAASAKGFSKTTANVTVSLGAVTSVPVQLRVGSASEVVEVTAEAPLVQAENGNVTSNFNSKHFDMLP